MVRTRRRAGRSTPTTSSAPACSTAGCSDRRIAHARIKSIDLSAAQKLPGVKAALALKDPPVPARTNVHSTRGTRSPRSQRPPRRSREDAIRLIKVDYDVLPVLATVEAGDESLMRPRCFPKGNVSRAVATAGRGRRGRAQVGRARRRRSLPHAGADAHEPRDARRHLRVGRRQVDGVDLDAGGPRRRATASPPR